LPASGNVEDEVFKSLCEEHTAVSFR
jgi:hypothetical protein